MTREVEAHVRRFKTDFYDYDIPRINENKTFYWCHRETGTRLFVPGENYNWPYFRRSPGAAEAEGYMDAGIEQDMIGGAKCYKYSPEDGFKVVTAKDATEQITRHIQDEIKAIKAWAKVQWRITLSKNVLESSEIGDEEVKYILGSDMDNCDVLVLESNKSRPLEIRRFYANLTPDDVFIRTTATEKQLVKSRAFYQLKPSETLTHTKFYNQKRFSKV